MPQDGQQQKKIVLSCTNQNAKHCFVARKGALYHCKGTLQKCKRITWLRVRRHGKYFDLTMAYGHRNSEPTSWSLNPKDLVGKKPMRFIQTREKSWPPAGKSGDVTLPPEIFDGIRIYDVRVGDVALSTTAERVYKAKESGEIVSLQTSSEDERKREIEFLQFIYCHVEPRHCNFELFALPQCVFEV